MKINYLLKKFSICFIFIIITFGYVFGQIPDSIYQGFNNDMPYGEMSKQINHIVKLCDLDSICLNKAASRLSKFDDKRILLKFYQHGALRSANTTLKPWAESSLVKGIKLAKSIDDKRELPYLYLTLARIFRRDQRADSAIIYNHLAITALESIGDYYNTWKAYNNLSFDYQSLRMDDLATEYGEKAYETIINSDKRNRMDEGYVLYHLLTTFISSNPEKFNFYLPLYLKFYSTSKSKNSHAVLSIFSDKSGAALALEGLLASNQNEALDKGTRHYTHFVLANIYSDLKQKTKARDHYELMASTGLQVGNMAAVQSSLQQLYKLEHELGNYQSSFKAFEAYDTIQKQYTQDKHLKTIADLNVRNDVAQKDKQIAVSQLQLQQAKKRQQFIGLGLLAALLLAALSYYALRIKSKSNLILAEKNEIIQKSLEEKDILLREIHHRVKNNLQMVSSLLYLHGKSIDDPTARDAVKESENRVKSMAMIHQKLYRNNDLLSVDMNDYLDRLLDHLFDSYDVDPNRIVFKKSINVELVDVDTIIPLALIINELVSNALKYAFNDGRNGEIEIVFEELEDNLLLSVKDNGIGMPEKFNLSTSGNFGYKLINILAEKLKAQWQLEPGEGTVILFEMPKAA